jgi:hypothetical protein
MYFQAQRSRQDRCRSIIRDEPIVFVASRQGNGTRFACVQQFHHEQVHNKLMECVYSDAR